MSEATVTAAAPATPKTSKPKVKKAGGAKKPATHPKYADMVNSAIAALKERNGSSRQAILKYIMANYNVGKDSNIVGSRLRMSLKRCADSGMLKRVKGTGASGSFRLAEKVTKKAVKKPKTPKKAKAAGEGKKVAKPKKAKKPKAAGAAKSPKAKKPAAKKAAKPKAAKKSPAKKAAKPKSPKKPKTPKAKKPAAKKSPKAKKPAAKKAAKK